MSRISFKVTGAQGQGINSVGEMCAKGLKRAGYCVFGYREYMSLIKGGHSSYQLDISNEKIQSTETKVDILVCFNHHGLKKDIEDVKEGGVILHQTPQWKFASEDQKIIDDRNITVKYLPTENILKELKARPILGNVLITSVVWGLLGRNHDSLKDLVREQFGHKGENIVKKNFECIDAGAAYTEEEAADLKLTLPDPNNQWSDHMLLTGSQAMGLGTIHAGCRMYVSYPMTPSSPLLTYLADMQNKTGMVVKQAEDEITAANEMTGAMMMGCRAATGTSGGGFDLMTETVSLNGVAENPSVFILAQRPGPATGLPTWTAQGDLLLAVGSAHGEFARLVVGVSDAEDCFSLMPEAFNYADEFQTPVIVMTDKQVAEALWTQPQYDQSKSEIRRGKLVTETAELKKLKGEDRYDPNAKDGVSPRWLPGAEAETFCTQGYEHGRDGSFDETSENTIEQVDKRMKKMEALKNRIPEPELFGDQNPETLIVSWGSNKGVILDSIKGNGKGEKGIGYLHYKYLWPMKTEKLKELSAKAKKTILVECNQQGQLGMIIKMDSGLDFNQRILKYDGRPFFVDELSSLLSA